MLKTIFHHKHELSNAKMVDFEGWNMPINYPSGIIRGSHEDVLQRYVKLQKETDADILVRVTADNPFTDFRLIPILIPSYEFHHKLGLYFTS